MRNPRPLGRNKKPTSKGDGRQRKEETGDAHPPSISLTSTPPTRSCDRDKAQLGKIAPSLAPFGSLNRVPASAGVKAGMSPPSGGR